MNALIVGRFHAVTRGQNQWLESLKAQPIERIVLVLTSADHSGTRRNPLDAAMREALVRPALVRAGKKFDVVRIDDVAQSSGWVDHLVAGVRAQAGLSLSAADTKVFSANRDVESLFTAQGFDVVSNEVSGLTPSELVQRVVSGRSWRDDASPETLELYSRPDVIERIRAIFTETLTTDDGELGHARDFLSYGAQMDASLRQKLDDIVPFINAGCIVDQGCGTGKLIVELSKLHPTSRFVGVDLSREFLRRCDENTYAGQDIAFIAGNVIERHVPEGSASTVIYSSVMHEVHSYTGYDVKQIDRALHNACESLEVGGRVIVRDGVSPEPAAWRLTFLNTGTRKMFERFAREFKKGQGARFERVAENQVQLSSHDANEFLCKKDYLQNWHIEIHEEFGPLTMNGWRTALERTGFNVVHTSQYVNEWIAKNRYEGTVRLTDASGAALPWPATNVIVVGEKRSTETP